METLGHFFASAKNANKNQQRGRYGGDDEAAAGEDVENAGDDLDDDAVDTDYASSDDSHS